MTETIYFEFLYPDGELEERARQIWDTFEKHPTLDAERYPDDEFVPGKEFDVYGDYEGVTALGTVRPFGPDEADRTFTAPPVDCIELEKSVDIWQTMEDPSDEIEAEITLIKDIFLATDPRPHFVYGLDPAHVEFVLSGWELPITVEDLKGDSLNDVSWLMIFSSAMVQSFGRSFLLNAPAWRTEELEDGSILIVAAPDPSDPQVIDLDPLRDYFGFERRT